MFDDVRTLNICIGWGANRTLPDTERRHLEAVYKRQFDEWLQWLPSHDNFPFQDIKINVVGWAARERALLSLSLDEDEVYIGFTDDSFMQPTCNPGCSRDKHLDGDYSGCPGGRDRRFHQILVIDPSWGDANMGAASGFGVSISLWGWENVGSKQERWPMLTHELVSVVA